MITVENRTCFILGSGKSLLDLSQEEVRLLNNHPRTLALNKFLLFYQKLNLVPQYFFLADRQYPAQFVFFESMRIARKLGGNIHFYVNEYYRDLQALDGRGFRRALARRRKFFADHGYWMPIFSRYQKIDFFKNDLESDLQSFYWADNLQEKLYFYRGSLTTAINLAAIIFPGADICLVGVDLKSLGSFFDEELGQVRRLHRGLDEGVLRKHKMAQEANLHLTALEYNGLPGVQAVLPKVVEHLRHKGVSLFSVNKNSLLVEAGICPHRSVEQCIKLS